MGKMAHQTDSFSSSITQSIKGNHRGDSVLGVCRDDDKSVYNQSF